LSGEFWLRAFDRRARSRQQHWHATNSKQFLIHHCSGLKHAGIEIARVSRNFSRLRHSLKRNIVARHCRRHCIEGKQAPGCFARLHLHYRHQRFGYPAAPRIGMHQELPDFRSMGLIWRDRIIELHSTDDLPTQACDQNTRQCETRAGTTWRLQNAFASSCEKGNTKLTLAPARTRACKTSPHTSISLSNVVDPASQAQCELAGSKSHIEALSCTH
jgi:hypothetical protein